MKKFFKEFKAFISRGNILDMAVGVIIGGAFSSIVTALTNKIIMPLINLLLSLGGDGGLEKAYTFLKVVKDSEGNIDLTKSIYIDWGAFITAIINFLLIALVLFIIIKVMMKADKMLKEVTHSVTDKELIKVKKAVRKQAKLDKKPFKIAWQEHLNQKEELAKQQAKIAEEQAKLEEESKPKVETEQELLVQIRDLLASKKEN